MNMSTPDHVQMTDRRGKWGLAHGPTERFQTGKMVEGRVPVPFFRCRFGTPTPWHPSDQTRGYDR
jgi:hypothetical protein